MIEIVQAGRDHTEDLNRFDSTFLVTCELVPSIAGDMLSYSFVDVVPYEKNYSNREAQDHNENKQPDVVFLAYFRGKFAGHVDISRHWNGYAYIDNIVVDKERPKVRCR